MYMSTQVEVYLFLERDQCSQTKQRTIKTVKFRLLVLIIQ